MVLAVIALVIGAWQFSMVKRCITNGNPAQQFPSNSITYLTSANAMLRNCDYVLYQVQAATHWMAIAAIFRPKGNDHRISMDESRKNRPIHGK